MERDRTAVQEQTRGAAAIPPAIKSQILATIFRYLNPETTTVFLFGSQAEHKSAGYSDIDVGIIGQGGVDDATFAELCHSLNNEVDTLKRIDLVDFDRVDESFREFALKEIEIWHTAPSSKGRSPT